MTANITNGQPSEKKMRRYTFVAFNSLNDTSVFKSISSDDNLLHILKNSGVVNFNYCTIDSISFLIVDMRESFNLEKTQILFNSLSEINPKLRRVSKIVEGEYQLLNRIYKMEQKVEYLPEEGQLIPFQKESYARFILTLEIINDSALAKEYVAVHAIGRAWTEITENMKTVGIHDMELYLIAYRAFLIMDTKPEFNWDVEGEKWGTLPREKEWQAYVAKFQKTNPESKTTEKWKAMNVISMSP